MKKSASSKNHKFGFTRLISLAAIVLMAKVNPKVKTANLLI